MSLVSFERLCVTFKLVTLKTYIYKEGFFLKQLSYIDNPWNDITYPNLFKFGVFLREVYIFLKPIRGWSCVGLK